MKTAFELISGFCKRKSVQIQGSQIANGVAKVTCPDHKKQCLDGYTCCKLANAKYGCCPFPKAVCCADGVHCCPNGQECQPGGECIRNIETLKVFTCLFFSCSLFCAALKSSQRMVILLQL